MTSITNVAPLGDMVIAIGKDEHRKLARVSKVLLRIASPVFKTMLGPSFKEGLCTYDTTVPLELPDDDPSAMTNLCQILHWNSKCVDTSEIDWLQKLAVVCDKYGCATKLSEYLRVMMTSHDFSVIDEFTMWAIVGDERKFGELSEQILRTPQSQAEAACHKDLLHILPRNMLSGIKDYRWEARRVYSETAQKPITSMYAYVAAKNGPLATLCVGLQKRLAAYYKALIDGSIVTENTAEDTALPDMQEYLIDNICNIMMPEFCRELNRQKRSHPCSSCSWEGVDAILQAVKDMKMGVTGQCKMCFNCFKCGNLVLLSQRKEHRNVSAAQVASATSGSAAPASSTDDRDASV